jgi:plastocyanin
MAQRRRCDVWRGGLVFLGLLLLLIGLLAACGRTIDDSGTAGIDGAAATRTALAASNPLTNPTVTVSNFIFTPASLTIDAGQTVTWNNTAEFTSHTATSDSGAPAAFDGLIGPGASFTFTFTQPGTYHYHCSIHPFMQGTIVVNAVATVTPGQTPTQTATHTPTHTPAPTPTAISTPAGK